MSEEAMNDKSQNGPEESDPCVSPSGPTDHSASASADCAGADAEGETMSDSTRSAASDAAEEDPAQDTETLHESTGDADESTPRDGDTSCPDDMSQFEDDVEDSELASAMARIGELDEDLARARADLYNLNQEYGNYVRRSKEAASAHRVSGQQEVAEALISVLDDIHAARQHGDLNDGPFAAIATKLEEVLKSQFGMERYGAEGDDFDPALHEALMAQTSADTDHPVIGQVLQPGYRMGDKVLRPTKVLVHNPQ